METNTVINSLWVLIAAILVLWMQAGFAMVETGFTRAKNSGNIMIKKIINFSLTALVFWIIGFGIMFGKDIGGVIGSPSYFAIGSEFTYPKGIVSYAFLFFQTVLCATATTVISGAMAERTKFISYCIVSIVMSAIIYPIAGHWIFGGGWLGKLGFHDFAGGTAIHSVGGWCALVGASILGPRIGKYTKYDKSNAIPGHSLTLGALGVFILWMGWFGFSGGLGKGITEQDGLNTTARIFLTTNLAAASSAISTMVITWIKYKKPDITLTLNGVLAGLVAIAAGCDVVTPEGSVIIGIIAGLAMFYGIEFVDKRLKVDDPVGTIGIHCVNGVIGTLLTGFFAAYGNSLGVFYGGGFGLLGIQVAGVIAVGIWSTLTAALLFKLIKLIFGLRVTREEELRGLDLDEHGLKSSYPDFLSSDLNM